MRFAKFFFVLLVSAVLFTVLFKVLMLVLFAGVLFGSFAFARRVFGYQRYGYHPMHAPHHARNQWQTPFSDGPGRHPEPLDPRWSDKTTVPPLGRRIEVI